MFPKPSKPTTKIDYSEFPFAKTRRVKNPKAAEDKRTPFCEVCGKSGKTEKHHIIRRSQGGNDEEFNLVFLCKPCHKQAHGTIQPKLDVKEIVERVPRLKAGPHWTHLFEGR